MIWPMLWNHISRAIRLWIQRRILKAEVGRQPYFIGWISPARLWTRYYKKLLYEYFYQDNHLSFCDKDEVFNVRRLKEQDGKRYQIHLRGFEDGELRAHYEISPEADPIRHYNGSTLTSVPVEELNALLELLQRVNATIE